MGEKEVGMLDVGTHCGFCRQLDFLPFHCSYCDGDFCQLHRLKEEHHCKWLLDHEELNREETVAKSGNGKYFQTLLPEKGYIRVKQNPQPSVTEPDSLKERLVRSGNTKALEKLKQFFSRNNKVRTKKGTKNSPTNKLLQVAKMKKNAIGDTKIPQANRIYVYCYVIDATDEHIKHEIFINQIWPVGRVLDYIAHQFDVQNYNTRSQSSVDEKLFLYLDDNGVPRPIDTASRAANTIKDADTLYLVRGEQIPAPSSFV